LKYSRLNDLVVVGEDQFYFTNAIYANLDLEVFLQLRWGSIGFFDGAKSKLIETGLHLPNGVMLSPNQKLVQLSTLQR
jgi:arylesterase / paraoxonase